MNRLANEWHSVRICEVKQLEKVRRKWFRTSLIPTIAIANYNCVKKKINCTRTRHYLVNREHDTRTQPNVHDSSAETKNAFNDNEKTL